jgi:hypothetical protein
MSNPILYPFDGTGTLPDNFVPNEQHNISNIGPTNAFLFVPEAAPFYSAGLSIVNSDGITLKENVDYYLSHYWEQASSDNAIGLPVYGSITMLGRNPVGRYLINYHTIGGEYVANKANAIADGFMELATTYLSVDWTSAPTSFPPTPHSLNTNAVAQYPLICETIMQLASAVRHKQDNISVNEIDGFVGVWANSTLVPILEMATSMNKSNNAFVNTYIALTRDRNKLIKPVGLPHYTLTLGSFTVKFGFHVFASNIRPSEIRFAGDPFPNACTLAQCWVSPADPLVAPTNDQVVTSAPQNDRVKISLTLDNYTGDRRISYFAIGN